MDPVDNQRVVEAIYAAFGRGDVPAVLARMIDDARWDFSVADSDVPWHAAANGPQEIQRFLGRFAEHVTVTRFEPRRFIASDTDVIVDVRLAYTIKKNGNTVDLQQLHWWSLDGGRVTRLRHFEDTAKVIAAWRGGPG